MALNEPVLVLNANYEPLNVCSVKRAIGLMMTGKAEVLAHGDGGIGTVDHTLPMPSILRLSRMVHRPRPRVKLTKREIFRRDKYTCQYCGKRSNLTIDHVVPRHRGGGHSWQNLVAACASCNRRKGGRTPQEAGMPIRTPPREPTASAEYRFAWVLETHEEWAEYIKGW